MAIERIVPGTIEWEVYYQNHIARYEFAKQQIENRRPIKILDAACGVGYGSYYLGQIANCSIIAIDRTSEALDTASKHFYAKNIKYLLDDCHTMSVAVKHGLYDVIISFETLEHLSNPEIFIANCFANLKEKGKLIISTPNQLVSSPEGKLNWEYHEKEYNPNELSQLLLNEGFKDITMYGQHATVIGNLRKQFRGELNRIYSNPFVRLGKFIQKILRGHKYSAILPEKPGDFEMKLYKNPSDIIDMGLDGPFVLIAVCEKP